jgi:hypothetical protein
MPGSEAMAVDFPLAHFEIDLRRGGIEIGLFGRLLRGPPNGAA